MQRKETREVRQLRLTVTLFIKQAIWRQGTRTEKIKKIPFDFSRANGQSKRMTFLKQKGDDDALDDGSRRNTATVVHIDPSVHYQQFDCSHCLDGWHERPSICLISRLFWNDESQILTVTAGLPFSDSLAILFFNGRRFLLSCQQQASDTKQ